MQVILRREAKAAGLKKYFTGKPCSRGHVLPRYTSGGCEECERVRNREYQKHRRRTDPVYAEKQRTQWNRNRKTPAARARILASMRKRKYGITSEGFEELWNRQKEQCAICDAALTRNKAHVDHNHTTKQIRGLLCGRCNVMIAMGLDNPLRLELGAAYLRKFK
jgi:hypothetical protein